MVDCESTLTLMHSLSPACGSKCEFSVLPPAMPLLCNHGLSPSETISPIKLSLKIYVALITVITIIKKKPTLLSYDLDWRERIGSFPSLKQGMWGWQDGSVGIGACPQA